MSTPQPGIAARYHDVCPRCGDDIAPKDRIVHARGRAIHVECASGQEDE